MKTQSPIGLKQLAQGYKTIKWQSLDFLNRLQSASL